MSKKQANHGRPNSPEEDRDGALMEAKVRKGKQGKIKEGPGSRKGGQRHDKRGTK